MPPPHEDAAGGSLASAAGEPPRRVAFRWPDQRVVDARRDAECSRPRIDERGLLRVGYLCDARFSWWERGGEAIREALEAAGASEELVALHRPLFALGAPEAAYAMDELQYGAGYARRRRGLPVEKSAEAPRSRVVEREDVVVVVPRRRRREERRAAVEARLDLFGGN